MPACLAAKVCAAGLAPHRRSNAWFWLTIWLFACLMLVAPAFAQQQAIPELQQRITDTTGTLNAETQSRLTQALAELEQRKGAQIAVLMVPTTGDEAIEQYAVRAFEQWKLGREAVDDGILFLVAKDDRRMRIEVGYGLEGAVPDLLAGRIIREQVAPRFQQGDFPGGVEAGVNSLITLVDGEELPPPVKAQEPSDSFSVIELIVIAFFVMALNPVVAAGAAFLLLLWSTGSVVFAVLAAMAAWLLSLAVRSRVAKGSSARASRQGGALGGFGSSGGFGGGGFRGGGGFGGGGFGGGGGSSGGGGASGSW